MKWKKTLIVVSSLVVLTLAVSIGNSFAFMSAKTDTKTNAFVKGSPGIDIHENSSATPNSTNSVSHTTKQVSVKNTGTIPAYLRVMLVPSYKFTSGTAAASGVSFTTMPQSIASTASSFSMGDLTLNLAANWGGKWFYVYDTTDQTGYFYYKDAVPAGDTTTLLLNSVALPVGMSYGSLQIDVIADSIQSDGGAVGSVWGKFVTENSANHTISAK